MNFIAPFLMILLFSCSPSVEVDSAQSSVTAAAVATPCGDDPKKDAKDPLKDLEKSADEDFSLLKKSDTGCKVK